MFTSLDDYLHHQTPEPVAQPATSDRNFYDRYFFNGYARSGELFFATALGVYPNRDVMDAAFTLVRDGIQTEVHASRRAPRDRTETRVGPVRVEVLEPLRRLRVSLEDNEADLRAELVFTARIPALQEPRFVRRQGLRTVMDYTRLTQTGSWQGWLELAGERIEIEPSEILGTRDRSWGLRPVGEREEGAPGPAPQFFWLWSPINFDDVSVLFDVNEEADGSRWHTNGQIAPVLDDPAASPADTSGVALASAVDHEVTWRPGTRNAQRARILVDTPQRGRWEIDLEPLLTFRMRGIGYFHPEWAHGVWKGEEAVGTERFATAEVDPLALDSLHVQQVCRARAGDREGVGVLEQLVIGPHEPSGLTDLLDGAPRAR